MEYGAGKENRTPLIGLEGRGNSQYTIPATWWRVVDSNHRRRSQRIYSPPPLATRETLQIVCAYSIEVLQTVNNKLHILLKLVFSCFPINDHKVNIDTSVILRKPCQKLFAYSSNLFREYK